MRFVIRNSIVWRNLVEAAFVALEVEESTSTPLVNWEHKYAKYFIWVYDLMSKELFLWFAPDFDSNIGGD